MVHRHKIWIITMLLLVVGCTQSTETTTGAVTTEHQMETTQKTEIINTQASQDATTFTMTGENFKFVMNGQDNPEIRVKAGDKIRIEFTSTKGFHDWVVDEFNAATSKVRPEDGTTAIEFIADKAGTYEYYCSIGSHRTNGMKGNLIVE